MSFCVEFVSASSEEAKAILSEEEIYLPDCVRVFVLKALEGIPSGAVKVRAVGHLCVNLAYEWKSSSAEISVLPFTEPAPVEYRKPKEKA